MLIPTFSDFIVMPLTKDNLILELTVICVLMVNDALLAVLSDYTATRKIKLSN